ncbi:hypothetical protein [Paracoccus sp. SM22M-07]|uniref:hypothetical protein n=1 Tax=Paracoccus sp. SM22M-07 TaxID=1520813 RepID=UPI000B3183BC|nr:hypothetical protein [Paracoccus sp. SM22M-07]
MTPEQITGLEALGSPVNYDHKEAMRVMAKCACKACGGTGERNDADCGDISYSTWACEYCGGKGWDAQAYREAFPVNTALAEDAARAHDLALEVERLKADLRFAEAALADIGDVEREDGDDLPWCERRAAKALPRIRATIRDTHAATAAVLSARDSIPEGE